MKVLKEKKGITLVALVITIIVLLILAGVTLSLVLGDNGVVTKADEAKTTSNQKEIEEQVKLKVQENITAHEGEFDIEDFWDQFNEEEGFTLDTTNKKVTKDGVTLSIGTKGEIAIVNEETVAVVEEEEEDTYVSSPEEWFATTENADGTLTIAGFNENVVTRTQVSHPTGTSGTNYVCEFSYNGEVITEIKIPKKIDGKIVKSIGLGGNNNNLSYWGNYYAAILNIEKVIIPEGVEVIGSYCFNGFYDLLEVTIPSTVEEIGDGAFNSNGGSYAYGRIETIKVIGKSERPSEWSTYWCNGNNAEIIWNYSE